MRLLVLDVEGTLFGTRVHLPGTSITSTIWQSLAKSLGPEAVSAEVMTHEQWAAGRYGSYLDWMRATIEIHQTFGLDESLFLRTIEAADYNPGVAEAFDRLNRCAFTPVLITGGFRALAARAQADLGIRHAFSACDYFFDDNGHLSGYNLLPCDFEGKLDFIHLMLREYGLRESDWVFVGDGANDVPIAAAAPLSIAYRPHPELRAVASHVMEDFARLSELLT